MPDRVADAKAVLRADLTGTTRLVREETEVVEVRKLERLKAEVRAADGRRGFGLEIRPETKEFVLLPSETWCTASMIGEIRAVLDDLEVLFAKASG